MKDLSGRLHQLRVDANNCAVMAMSATDPNKRELLKRLADELAIEALELEQVVKSQTGHVGSNEQYDAFSKPALDPAMPVRRKPLAGS
ncbi:MULTISPECIES: hypothetical protein [Bradyrhizobium]|jgi:hypothetical protein|uniref:hypothetical protein n=1 Tax=Bradyrhizobium elkanii TaxID=29448 RepID=UPI0004094A5A|nr:hypothetical protein [Bradyrhizobium elkanii]